MFENILQFGLLGFGKMGKIRHQTLSQMEQCAVQIIYEYNDKFAIDRYLPDNIKMGDILVIHDVGAYSYSMGFNYGGKLRSAEYLLKEDSTVELIRQPETLKDYFATISFNEL